MKIGILGTGRMGQGLAEVLGRAGHDVVLGSRTPGSSIFPTVALPQAIRHGEVLLVALPHAAIEPLREVLSAIAPGRVVVDVANAVSVDDGRIRSALEQPHGRWLADRLPHVKVARAFTHVPDELLVSRAMRQPNTWAIAVAADHSEAMTVAENLVRDAGYVPVPVGDLDHSSVLDAGGPLFPHLYLPRDMGDLVARCGSVSASRRVGSR